MLTEQQQRFADEYLKDLNGTQAAIRAGYSEKTAAPQASRLLTNVNIIDYLNSKRIKLQEQTDISQEWVLKKLKDQYEQANDVKEFTPAIRALELLGKTFAMFTDKQENSGKITLKHEDALNELE